MFGGCGRRKLMERLASRAQTDPTPTVRAFMEFVGLLDQRFRARIMKLRISQTMICKV